MIHTNRLEQGGRTPLKLAKPSGAEGAEVFYNSLTLQGELLPDYVFRKLQEPNNAGVILFGESGAGKTTDTGQIIKDTIGLSGGGVWIHAITSGLFLTRLEKYVEGSIKQGIDIEGYNGEMPILGPDEEFDRSKMPEDMWRWGASTLARDLNVAIERSLQPNIQGPFVPKRLVADIAGLGEQVLTGRLASGLVEVARAFPENVVFLAIPGNPDIQDRSLRLRVEAGSLLAELSKTRGSKRFLTAEEILKRMPLSIEEDVRIRVLLERENLVTDTDLVSSLISIREGTRPDRFQRVREALVQEVIDWARETEDFETIDLVSEQLELFERKGLFRILDKDKKGLYEMKLAYTQNYLHRVLGIPPDSDQGRVVLVPYLEDTTIHQWPELLRQSG